MDKAVFFDRDGVLNREIGDYVCKPEDFEILPDAVETMKDAMDLGYKIFVITNQGGIGKRLYTKEILKQIHAILIEACNKQGVVITEIFYCPHHPVRSNCICRKPNSLMLEKALAKYNIDPALSWMIGDTGRDMEAAAAAGVRGYLINPNSLKHEFLKML
ncbi:MAG: HAD family hydrolase [Bacteroidia bacterium]|nr:HAD family hydrolase [Bacteroidia bacterium]